MSDLESTVADAIKQLDDLHAAYLELEGTEIPSSIDQAVKQRWEIAVAGFQVVGYTGYLPQQQEEDSRRAVSLKAVYRVIRDLEETIIRRTVIKPETQIANAYWSVEFTWSKRIWDASAYIVQAVKQVLSHPEQSAKVVWFFFANIVLLKWIAAAEVLSMPEIANEFFHGMKMRNEAEKKLRREFLPQRSSRRFRVKRASRK